MIKRSFIVLGLVIGSLAMAADPSLVNTDIIKKGVVNPLEEFIGTVSFSKCSDVASQSSGAVIEMSFESGDKVKKGDVLLKIDSKVLDAKIRSADALLESSKIDLQNASKDFVRYKRLIAQRSISQKIFDDSHFKVDSAKETLNFQKASLDELMTQKEKKTVLAPFDGVIVEKNTEISQWLNMGSSVATLVDTNNIDLIFSLPTSYIYRLEKNREYAIDLGGETMTSRLYAFIAKGDRLTRTYPVKFKAETDERFLYDGMEATIRLPRNKKVESLIVPRDAVIKRSGDDVVFVVDERSKAVMIPIRVIGYERASIAISGEGLSVGMKVIVKGNERIFPNASVKIINRQE